MDIQIARTIIYKCLGYKKGEQLLIVCDDNLLDPAQILYKTARADKIECLLIEIPPAKLHGQEPPKEVATALKQTDIALLLTSMSLSHTQARKKASKKYGVRMASLPGITLPIFRRSIQVDYSSLKQTTKKMADRLSKGKKLEVFTNNGTHLVMSIKNRLGFSDNGLYTKPGAFGNLPAGEACIAPCEGTTNGSLIVDGSAPFAGKIKKPLKLDFKNGFLQKMPIKKIAALIKPLGRPARSVAELGIGLNPLARITGNTLEDEKKKGTAHLAIGANISFGGKVSCPCHLDFVFRDPNILIDGEKINI